MPEVNFIEIEPYKGIGIEIGISKLKYNLGYSGYVVFYVPIKNGFIPKPRFVVKDDNIFASEEEARVKLKEAAMAYIDNGKLNK